MELGARSMLNCEISDLTEILRTESSYSRTFSARLFPKRDMQYTARLVSACFQTVICMFSRRVRLTSGPGEPRHAGR
jgi:hypothetical protein